jgi:hypothetical protein
MSINPAVFAQLLTYLPLRHCLRDIGLPLVLASLVHVRTCPPGPAAPEAEVGVLSLPQKAAHCCIAGQ